MKNLFNNADFNASFIEALLIVVAIIANLGHNPLLTTVLLLITLIIKLLFKNDTSRNYTRKH